MQQTGVRSLVWEDPLERRMATHSSILTWENPWTEEPGRLQAMRSQELDTTQQLTHYKIKFIRLIELQLFFFKQWYTISKANINWKPSIQNKEDAKFR